MKQYKTFLPWLIVLTVFVALLVGSLTPAAVAQLEGVTNFNGLHLTQTTFGTATPQLMVQNGGSNVSIEVRNGSATPVWSVGQTGAVAQSAALDMQSQIISNIGATGTDFTATGGLTLADDLNMSAQPIVNIGNAGTDFGTDGGLTTAAGIGITAGGLTVTAGAVAANAGITVDSTAFTVADTSGNTQIAGTLGVTGTSAFVGNATYTGFQISTSQSITPTDGAVFTPTAGIVILTPAGEVTPTIAACAGGEHLILYDSENQAVNLADGGNFVLASALALGQYDAVQLVCIATKWVQVSAVSAN